MLFFQEMSQELPQEVILSGYFSQIYGAFTPPDTGIYFDPDLRRWPWRCSCSNLPVLSAVLFLRKYAASPALYDIWRTIKFCAMTSCRGTVEIYTVTNQILAFNCKPRRTPAKHLHFGEAAAVRWRRFLLFTLIDAVDAFFLRDVAAFVSLHHR